MHSWFVALLAAFNAFFSAYLNEVILWSSWAGAQCKQIQWSLCWLPCLSQLVRHYDFTQYNAAQCHGLQPMNLRRVHFTTFFNCNCYPHEKQLHIFTWNSSKQSRVVSRPISRATGVIGSYGCARFRLKFFTFIISLTSWIPKHKQSS